MSETVLPTSLGSHDDRTNGSYQSRFDSYHSMNSPTPSVIVREGSYPINSPAFATDACVCSASAFRLVLDLLFDRIRSPDAVKDCSVTIGGL